jgi:uncharacterized protein involved in response to NO
VTAPVLTAGFRPLFLAAASWSAIALALWIGMLAGGFSLPSRFDPLAWHVHEMLFGFVMAAIGGFLLTAISNWTGRPPIAGAPLAALAGLWALGRAACVVSALFPAWLAPLLDLAFPVALEIVAARELIAGGNRRNYPLLAPLIVLCVANVLMHLEALGLGVSHGIGWRLGVAAVMVLISVIGGRIVPAFTRNWLTAQGVADLPPSIDRIDRIALGTLHGGLLLWVFLPNSAWIGGVLLAAAAVNAWRLARWRGHVTMQEPLLLILHVGYAWLIVGVALLGLALLSPDVPLAAALHALTGGAIGTMILAVMTRASLGHTGRTLHADAATLAIFALISLAAVLRVGASWPSASMFDLLVASAICWIGAFLLFVLRYGPMLLTRRAS